MKKFKFNKPLVESHTAPSDINTYWVDVDENTGKVSTVKEYNKGDWETVLSKEESVEYVEIEYFNDRAADKLYLFTDTEKYEDENSIKCKVPLGKPFFIALAFADSSHSFHCYDKTGKSYLIGDVKEDVGEEYIGGIWSSETWESFEVYRITLLSNKISKIGAYVWSD